MDMKKELKSYVIFGIGKFGRSVAEELSLAGHKVLAVDKDREKVEQVADTVTMAVVADVNDARQMEGLGLKDFDAAVVTTTGDLSATVMCIMLLKEAGVKQVIAKASDERQAEVYKKLGADQIIIPEKEAALSVAHILLNKDLLNVYELSDDFVLAEVAMRSEWAGKSLRSLDLRRTKSVTVAAIRVNGELFSNWDADKALPSDATVVLITSKTNLNKLVG